MKKIERFEGIKQLLENKVLFDEKGNKYLYDEEYSMFMVKKYLPYPQCCSEFPEFFFENPLYLEPKKAIIYLMKGHTLYTTDNEPILFRNGEFYNEKTGELYKGSFKYLIENYN